MLPVRKSGGPGKEVPPERARTNRRKKERSATGNSLKKTRRPASTKWKRICLAPLVKGLKTHASAAVFDARRKRWICSPIDPLTGKKSRP